MITLRLAAAAPIGLIGDPEHGEQERVFQKPERKEPRGDERVQIPPAHPGPQQGPHDDGAGHLEERVLSDHPGPSVVRPRHPMNLSHLVPARPSGDPDESGRVCHDGTPRGLR